MKYKDLGMYATTFPETQAHFAFSKKNEELSAFGIQLEKKG
ncbi:hypothetical protein GCM10007877_37560 [Marinibactrum halimedae]|uniref:Uncharacterized protein n=1 Tax=Marinibactrum halimedae TaxID=1444977 RepID=A0AA37TAW9_9GAMM|nr:hypothetical protein GCM10007877_37560 [Marinibactrum halimedae]